MMGQEKIRHWPGPKFNELDIALYLVVAEFEETLRDTRSSQDCPWPVSANLTRARPNSTWGNKIQMSCKAELQIVESTFKVDANRMYSESCPK